MTHHSLHFNELKNNRCIHTFSGSGRKQGSSSVFMVQIIQCTIQTQTVTLFSVHAVVMVTMVTIKVSVIRVKSFFLISVS